MPNHLSIIGPIKQYFILMNMFPLEVFILVINRNSVKYAFVTKYALKGH